MIAPLVPFAVRGAIWYQGESNAGAAYEYRTLFPTMIEDWRRHWNYDMPFLAVQLAPFMKINPEPMDSSWAELREAQLIATQKLPSVGMAVITDVGEENDIHPKKKEPVGARLALLARRIAYGQPIVANGPTYHSMRVDGNRAVLFFDNFGSGLERRGDKLTGFHDRRRRSQVCERPSGDPGKYRYRVCAAAWKNQKRSASAGPIIRLSICGTKTACPRRRSARMIGRASRSENDQRPGICRNSRRQSRQAAFAVGQCERRRSDFFAGSEPFAQSAIEGCFQCPEHRGDCQGQRAGKQDKRRGASQWNVSHARLSKMTRIGAWIR